MKTNKTMLCVLGSTLLFAVAAASAADAPKLERVKRLTIPFHSASYR